jgi:hypothetical protein
LSEPGAGPYRGRPQGTSDVRPTAQAHKNGGALFITWEEGSNGLRCAREFLGHAFSANRARQVEITTRGIVLQRVLTALYLSAARGHGISRA